MAITNDSKDVLKERMAKLDEMKSYVQSEIDSLNVSKDKLVARKQEINQQILNLKQDIDNG